MVNKSYNEDKIYNYDKEKMILRDFLAADRTLLANERTLLAYIRTGIGIIAIAITLIKLFDDAFTYALGILFIFVGIIPMILGVQRYKRINRKIENVIYK
jgi:Predicted membrane protein